MSSTEIRIAALDEGSNAITLEVGDAELGLTEEDEVSIAGRVEVVIEAVKVDDTVDLRGVIAGAATATCARCAADARIELNLPFRLIGKERREGEEAEVVDSEDLVYHDGNVLDLADALRQIVLVSVPMAPVCKESCRGLCPTCGADLNVESCSCKPATGDPRWQKLDELLDRDRER